MIAVKLNQRDINMRHPSSHYPAFKHSMSSQSNSNQLTIVVITSINHLHPTQAVQIIKRPSPSSIQCPFIVCLGWRCTQKRQPSLGHLTRAGQVDGSRITLVSRQQESDCSDSQLGICRPTVNEALITGVHPHDCQPEFCPSLKRGHSKWN